MNPRLVSLLFFLLLFLQGEGKNKKGGEKGRKIKRTKLLFLLVLEDKEERVPRK